VNVFVRDSPHDGAGNSHSSKVPGLFLLRKPGREASIWSNGRVRLAEDCPERLKGTHAQTGATAILFAVRRPLPASTVSTA